MKATEKLTFDQANELVKNHVKKRIEERNESEWVSKLTTELSVYQSFFEYLLHKDPTEVAVNLFLVDRQYVITKFNSSDDTVGEVLQYFTSESVCDYFLESYQKSEPEFIFAKSIKLTEK